MTGMMLFLSPIVYHIADGDSWIGCSLEFSQAQKKRGLFRRHGDLIGHAIAPNHTDYPHDHHLLLGSMHMLVSSLDPMLLVYLVQGSGTSVELPMLTTHLSSG